MKVPLFDDMELSRLRRAYAAGVSAYDLSCRFGIGESLVLDVARGRRPPDAIAVGSPLSNLEELKLERKRRIRSCQLHFMDLVSAYRPEVIRKYKEIQAQRRKPAILQQNKPLIGQEADAPAKPSLPEDFAPIQIKRSLRIFEGGLRLFKMTAAEMTGKTRTQQYTRARQTLMFVIYSECSNKESTPSIGRMFNKDHSTVVHAIHKTRALLAQGDKEISANVAILRGVR